MIIGILTMFLANTVSLPAGYEQALWGITTSQLKQIAPVVKVKSGANYRFAEHMEIDPDVYVLKDTKQNKKIEYYFYKGKLYKIFVVYDRKPQSISLYKQIKDNLVSDFGNYKRNFKQKVFGLVVTHTQWEDEKTLLDLREGAGFVYQVRIDRDALKIKEMAYHLKKAI
jgi:hypothetical protein